MRSVLCAQSWHSFDDPYCHLLLMIDFDCPLAFRHKKGEYTLVGFLFSGAEFFCLLELVEIRLYLGASLCIYLFWLLMYFCWAIHVRGRYIFFLFYMFLVSLLIDLYL